MSAIVFAARAIPGMFLRGANLVFKNTAFGMLYPNAAFATLYPNGATLNVFGISSKLGH